MAKLKASNEARSNICEWLDVGLMENRNDLMRACIIVFDWIIPVATYEARRVVLEATFKTMLPDNLDDALRGTRPLRSAVYLINEWCVEDELKLYNWLKRQNEHIGHKFYEGLVAKRVDSLYTFGRKPKQVTPDWIKHRFDQ